jgi:hypothetical protein
MFTLPLQNIHPAFVSPTFNPRLKHVVHQNKCFQAIVFGGYYRGIWKNVFTFELPRSFVDSLSNMCKIPSSIFRGAWELSEGPGNALQSSSMLAIRQLVLAPVR